MKEWVSSARIDGKVVLMTDTGSGPSTHIHMEPRMAFVVSFKIFRTAMSEVLTRTLRKGISWSARSTR